MHLKRHALKELAKVHTLIHCTDTHEKISIYKRVLRAEAKFLTYKTESIDREISETISQLQQNKN